MKISAAFLSLKALRDRRRGAAAGAILRLLARVLLRLSAASLVIYHGFLLWGRVKSLTLLDPVVAVRWGVTAALLVGFARLWRAGEPLLLGRKASVVWSLVILLHASMVPGLGLTATLVETDAGLWLALGLSGLLVLLGAGAAVSQARPGRGMSVASRRLAPSAIRALCIALLSPRPPPAI